VTAGATNHQRKGHYNSEEKQLPLTNNREKHKEKRIEVLAWLATPKRTSSIKPLI
jgi:hypothetical protein